jgi:predicted permease
VSEKQTARAVARYRRLLWMYPRDFRTQFEESMCAAFAAEFEMTSGKASRSTLWTVTVMQALVHAAAEWLGVVRKRDSRLGRGLGVDLRVAVRTLRRRPDYAAVVIATLAIGIGATAIVFNLVNAYLFASLPFHEANRLVYLRDMVARPGETAWQYTPTPRSFYAMREGFNRFSSVAAHQYRVVNVATDVDVTQVVGPAVSDAWLETLGVEPVLGRGFSAEEQRLGSQARVTLLSHGLWTRLLGADPAAIGRPVLLDGEPYTAIGVLPPGFHYPWGAQLWTMADFDPNSGAFGTAVVARLTPGTEPQAVRLALAEFSSGIATQYPETHRDITFVFTSMREQIFGNRPGVGLVLLSAVGLLLLIACANVAGVSVVRVLSRDRELAVRRALGGSRRQLFRLVFLEGAVLTTIGGGLGLGAVWLTKGWLMGLVTTREAGLTQVATALDVDGRVTTFTVGVTLLVTLVAGLVPALKAMWSRPSSVAQTAGRSGFSPYARRVLRTVVVVETALAVVLLLAATLVYDSYDQLASVDRGYESSDRFAVGLSLPERRFSDGASRLQMLRRVVERLEAEPGVYRAGYTHHLPVTPGNWTRGYSVEGIMASESGRSVLANVRWVGRSYFDALGMRMVRGRVFTTDEMDGAADVVVLSELLARKHFGDDDPVGRQFKVGGLSDATPWLEIVGVVEQAQEEWAFNESFYLPYTSNPLDFVELVVHAAANIALPDVREAVREVDPGQAVDQFRSLSMLEREDLRSDRTGAMIIAFFGLSGLALSVLGIYGVVAYSVRQRDREMGIRVALGSRGGNLIWFILKEGTSALGTGVGVGLLVAIATLPFISNRLSTAGESVQVQLLANGLELSTLALAAVAGTVLFAGVVACLIPACRVLVGDPVRVLRQE